MVAAPVQQFVTSQRLRISYWDWGNEAAPLLLFVHGGSDHARSWDRIAEGLRDDYHVAAIDMRGHGDSDWAPGSQYSLPDMALDVVHVIEHLGAPAFVVGHSMGASTSLLAAGMTQLQTAYSEPLRQRLKGVSASSTTIFSAATW